MKGRWIASLKDTPLDKLAPMLGLRVGRGNSLGPCPACNEERRGSDDPRFAAGLASDRRGWTCHKCGVKGDAVDLLSYSQHGLPSAQLTSAQWGDMRDWAVGNNVADEVDSSPTGGPRITSVGAMTSRLLGEERPKRQRARQRAEPSRRGENSGRDDEQADGPSQRGSGGPFGWRDGLAEDCAADLWDVGSRQSDTVLAYLRDGRKFTDETIKEWGLGVAMIKGEPWLTIPLRDASERVVNVRFRSVPPAKKTYRVCTGRPLPLFGSDRLGTDKGTVVICEGELDVIAMWQYGFTVSVVSGTAGAGAWKDEWLDELEPYNGYLLVYDNDEAGEKGAQGFAERMGVERCSRVILPKKDAGECLEYGVSVDSVQRVMDRAQPMFGPQFKRVHEYFDDIERLIEAPEDLVGRTTGSERLDRCLGGLRPGLMVLSGDTGHGKTTFATWLLCEQARLGVPVMVTSFEQKPVGTVQKLLRMELGGDFLKVDADARKVALERLGSLPIHILHHYGHLSAVDLMQTLRYAVRRLGVKAVLVDHLGFLLDPNDEDERRAIEAVIRALAVTAYSLGVTIILVAHPKGLPPGQPRVTINDLKGASAIKQDASEVVIVVRDPPRPNAKPPRPWPAAIVHFDKVRSEFGVPGSRATLAFGPLSCTYADTWEHTPEGNAGTLLVVPDP